MLDLARAASTACSGYMKKSDNPDVLFGRDFDEEASPIEELEGEVGQVVIRGKILTCEAEGAPQRKHAFFIFGDRLYRHDRRQDLCTGRYAG